MAKTVWVVDDEPLIRSAICAVLAELGYTPAGYENAESLYTALVDARQPPDLLLLDHMLPDEDGAQILHSLRERPQYRDIPAIFVTAVSDEEAQRLNDLAPVVRKPFDFRDLVAEVERALGASPNAGAFPES